MGYLELPQVAGSSSGRAPSGGRLSHKLLQSDGVYLVDCLGEGRTREGP